MVLCLRMALFLVQILGLPKEILLQRRIVKKYTILLRTYSKRTTFPMHIFSCCGAGTAADTMKVTEMVSSNVELHRLNTGRQPRVILPLRLLKNHLFNYQVTLINYYVISRDTSVLHSSWEVSIILDHICTQSHLMVPVINYLMLPWVVDVLLL